MPTGIYIDTNYWTSEQIASYKTGSVQQTTYTYRMLGGDVLDIEITEKNVYAAYEAACTEYSYIVNTHQSKNVLPYILGFATGTFDSKGQLTGSDISSSVHLSLKFPKFSFGLLKQVGNAVSEELSLNGTETVYSASFAVTEGQQAYDLQNIISASALQNNVDYYNLVGDKRIIIKKVYYKTPAASWNFYGGYAAGGIAGLGSFGSYANSTTFQVMPTWENKLMAMAFEDAMYTRASHYSFDIRNNRIRIFPSPRQGADVFWIEFVIPSNPWGTDTSVNGTPYSNSTIDGINNMNSIPFQNIPYDKINSIGKQWIRRYCLELCKEILGQVRSKFDKVPIPGDSVTLNGSALIQQSETNREKLREELIKTLADMVYTKLGEDTTKLMEETNKASALIPMIPYTG